MSLIASASASRESWWTRGDTANYDYALEALKNIHYAGWRKYSPEDTVRFYALRLHEVGLIKSTPKKVIAEGTDWSFFNQLKKELKDGERHH